LLLLLYNLSVNVKIIFARIEIESSLALYLSLLFIRSNVYQKPTQKIVEILDYCFIKNIIESYFSCKNASETIGPVTIMALLNWFY
jgi:hypothetical protein